MRCFIGFEVEADFAVALEAAAASMAPFFAKGRFTLPGNHHLTLHFLGEQPEEAVERAKRAMEDLRTLTSFAAEVEGLGTFGKPGHWVLHGVVGNSSALQELHGRLAQALTAQGFSLESRPHRPHITLGRNLRLREGVSLEAVRACWLLAGTVLPVTRIVLFESVQREGWLTYVPRHCVPLAWE